MARTPKKRSKLAGRKFDINGVRKAIIATLTSAYNTGRFRTIPHILTAMEVIDAELDGQPHSMRSLSEKLNISYATLSRIIFGLTAEGGEGRGILTLKSHGNDRRRKVIGVDPAAFAFFDKGPHGAAERAMTEYYGQTVKRLKSRSRAARG